MAFYVDTSALTKLVVVEPETAALHAWATADPHRVLVSSDLARTELLRAVRRADPDAAVRARTVLDTLILLKVTTAVFQQAARLEPAELRSLDSIHLAAALALGDDLDAVVCYDERLSRACRLNGIEVLAPA